jgi:purine nucleosidase
VTTIIIDTDPGQDDAVAILLALASPDELDVLGITAVAGNVPLPLTARNARMMVELAGRPEVPVYAGCDQPLVRDLVTAEYVHGRTGLDGAELPEPTVPLADGHAVDFLIATLRDPVEPVTVCTLGPLTNLATALTREPSIGDGVREIVMMGGGFFEGGNVTPAAEFNIYVDPQAADIVFRSGLPLVLMPLDVTHRALITRTRLQRFGALESAVGTAVTGLLEFFERYDVEKYGSDGGPLHDPTVIAYLLDPTLLRGKRVHVAVETTSELTMGMTVVDWWAVTGHEPNCTVMNEIDDDRFFDLLVERLARL